MTLLNFTNSEIKFRSSLFIIYRMFQEEMSIFWEVIISIILSKKLYMYMCTILVSEIELFHCRDPKLLMSKHILRTVSNTGIYCSRDKVGTVYLVLSRVSSVMRRVVCGFRI
jgi:TctA family transporter